jgi:DNA gyrase subunit A
MIDNPDCSIMDLGRYIKGPDFRPTALFYGTPESMKRTYDRQKAESRSGQRRISRRKTPASIIAHRAALSGKPFMLRTHCMVALVQGKENRGISDIRKRVGRKGMRIVIEVKKDANRSRIEPAL